MNRLDLAESVARTVTGALGIGILEAAGLASGSAGRLDGARRRKLRRFPSGSAGDGTPMVARRRHGWATAVDRSAAPERERDGSYGCNPRLGRACGRAAPRLGSGHSVADRRPRGPRLAGAQPVGAGRDQTRGPAAGRERRAALAPLAPQHALGPRGRVAGLERSRRSRRGRLPHADDLAPGARRRNRSAGRPRSDRDARIRAPRPLRRLDQSRATGRRANLLVQPGAVVIGAADLARTRDRMRRLGRRADGSRPPLRDLSLETGRIRSLAREAHPGTGGAAFAEANHDPHRTAARFAPQRLAAPVAARSDRTGGVRRCARDPAGPRCARDRGRRRRASGGCAGRCHDFLRTVAARARAAAGHAAGSLAACAGSARQNANGRPSRRGRRDAASDRDRDGPRAVRPRPHDCQGHDRARDCAERRALGPQVSHRRPRCGCERRGTARLRHRHERREHGRDHGRPRDRQDRCDYRRERGVRRRRRR